MTALQRRLAFYAVHTPPGTIDVEEPLRLQRRRHTLAVLYYGLFWIAVLTAASHAIYQYWQPVFLAESRTDLPRHITTYRATENENLSYSSDFHR